MRQSQSDASFGRSHSHRLNGSASMREMNLSSCPPGLGDQIVWMSAGRLNLQLEVFRNQNVVSSVVTIMYSFGPQGQWSRYTTQSDLDRGLR